MIAIGHKVGVVIPTLNAAATLGRCLDSLREQTRRPDDVFIVDGGSQDGSVAIAYAGGACVLRSVANRSTQRNLGAEAAKRDELLLFIDADMVLSSRVIAECVSRFSIDHAGLVIPEISVGSTMWARVKAFERQFYQGVWWMEAARCFKRSQMLSVGGFDPALVGGEDWDLDQRMRQVGAIGRIAAPIYHDEGPLRLGKLIRKKEHYADTLQAYRCRHPERARMQLALAPRLGLFLRQPNQLVRHPTLTLGLLCLGVAEWFAAKRPRLLDTLDHPSSP